MKNGDIVVRKVERGYRLYWICSNELMPCSVCEFDKEFGCAVENEGKVVCSRVLKEVSAIDFMRFEKNKNSR